MKTPGEPVHGETYAFDFVTLDPRPDPARMLAILLHGVGGDETQLAGLGARLPEDVLVAMPRGQRTISGGRVGWFRESLSEDGAEVVEDEAEDARLRLVDFVARLQARFDVPPERTVLIGYSQGGMLAASVALTEPSRVAGFAMLCGRVPPEMEPRIEANEATAALEAFVAHGREDATLPLEWAERAKDLLASLGIDHAYRLHDAGHELTAAMEDATVGWFNDPARRWNRSVDGAAHASG